jgi:hypothetical protein
VNQFVWNWPSVTIHFNFFTHFVPDNVAGLLATNTSLLFCRSLSAQSGCVFVKGCWLIVCFVEQGCSTILYILCFQGVIVFCSKPSFMFFMPVGVILYFTVGIPQVIGIRWTFLHLKCILVLSMVLLAPVNNVHCDSEYRETAYPITWSGALLTAVQAVHNHNGPRKYNHSPIMCNSVPQTFRSYYN